MQVGTTKDQDLYNKPSAAVHPGPLAAGTLPQYNTGASCWFVYITGYDARYIHYASVFTCHSR